MYVRYKMYACIIGKHPYTKYKRGFSHDLFPGLKDKKTPTKEFSTRLEYHFHQTCLRIISQ